MPMSELRAVNPPGWARSKGYSNGIVARGTQVFVADRARLEIESTAVIPDRA
jgi:hypothetical protein